LEPIALAWSPLAPLVAVHGEQAQRWLADTERRKLARMRSPQRRAQFVAGRWLLRELLARCHGGTPQHWRLTAPEQGPPAVEALSGAAPLHLALSHSADLVACAVAAVPIGVDVELPQRRRDIAGLAALCCDEREQTQLKALAPAQREGLFYEFWTAKEAWLKSQSHDLAPKRLAQIHLAPAASDEAAHVRVWRGDGWTLALAAPPGSPVRWHAAEPALHSCWQVRDEGLLPGLKPA
jgi:4'-phosphopantetheinyl transferase